MLRIVSVVCLGIFLTGCFNNEASDCSDYETKQLVMQIVSKELNKTRASSGGYIQDGDELNLSNEEMESNLSLLAIRTTKFNEDVGSYRCAANLNIKMNNKKTGKRATNSFPITYTSELADDGDSFYVQVFGL